MDSCQGGGSGDGVRNTDGDGEGCIWHDTNFGRCHTFSEEISLIKTYAIS